MCDEPVAASSSADDQDSQELPTPPEKPGAALVVVSAFGWTGIYVNTKRVHTVAPHERPYRGDDVKLAVNVAQALTPDITISYATADRLADDLSAMQLS